MVLRWVSRTAASRLSLCLTTWPASWRPTLAVTAASCVGAGVFAVATDFIDPVADLTKPNPVKMLSAFVFPSLLEEILWRGILLPHPTSKPIPSSRACLVLFLHVIIHPIIGESGIWPRGKDTFGDIRFLILATIVLGGSTASYILSGGSVYAAAFAHAVPLVLWRDCFGGEKKLGLITMSKEP